MAGAFSSGFSSAFDTSATSLQAVSVIGLTASTEYKIHYVHVDAAGNQSLLSSSAAFTTDAASGFSPAWAGNINNLIGAM